MTTTRNGLDGGNKCRVKLERILAIIVRKEGCVGDPGDFWMYENGYLLFQGLINSNSICWWNNGLNGATKSLVYYGYVNPGAILVGTEPCALEIVKNAWATRVLQPPPGYQIVALEDIEHCITSAVPQTQWTPLPEAVCSVVLRLSGQGRPAGIETIREALIIAFPHVSPPSEQILYDTLVQLAKERKLYNTSSGYYIVTPEKKRSRSHSRSGRRDENGIDHITSRTMLMSTEEALTMVHGDITTVRDGKFTHQCIQTNLADVICGGNASDKIIYPRKKRRSASFPDRRSSDRRGSFRMWSSERRLKRSASTRTVAKNNYGDTSSSTEYPNSRESTPTPKKASLLTRLFRRSKRSQCQRGSYSAQFPPTEWFNSKTTHLHSVGTQTEAPEEDSSLNIASYLETCIIPSSRSATLPRNHRRHISNDMHFATPFRGSRENSPISRFANSSLPSTLPRKHGYRSKDSPRKTTRSGLTKPSALTEPANEETPQENQQKSISNDRLESAIDTVKASHRYPTGFTFEGTNSSTPETPAKNASSSIDNSGPSSIESHKSSKTGSSLNSAPSSIESRKTVISRHLVDSSKGDSRSLRRHYKKDPSKIKTSPKQVRHSSLPHSSSFTLQVTTNQNGVKLNEINATTTTGVNNTKIFVQNSPVRSVITFENGQTANSPNVVVVNGEESQTQRLKASPTPDNKTINDVPTTECKPSKNTNHQQSLINSIDTVNESGSEAMNNSRNLILQLPSKDSLNYHNLIKNVSPGCHNQFNSTSNPDSPITSSFREFSRNTLFTSSPPSPNKSYEGLPNLSSGKYIKNDGSKTSLDKSFASVEKNIIGSEPNICLKDKTPPREAGQFPSLSDLSFNFTSLAAQKILKGVSINSIDTLLELNMAAEKQNNCDVVHTDFGVF